MLLWCALLQSITVDDRHRYRSVALVDYVAANDFDLCVRLLVLGITMAVLQLFRISNQVCQCPVLLFLLLALTVSRCKPRQEVKLDSPEKNSCKHVDLEISSKF